MATSSAGALNWWWPHRWTRKGQTPKNIPGDTRHTVTDVTAVWREEKSFLLPDFDDPQRGLSRLCLLPKSQSFEHRHRTVLPARSNFLEISKDLEDFEVA